MPEQHHPKCRWYVPGEQCSCEVVLLTLDSDSLPTNIDVRFPPGLQRGDWIVVNGKVRVIE